jgi:Ca2+-binding RTX toxin-like protein
MAAQPESAFTAGWLVTLLRAQEIGLTRFNPVSQIGNDNANLLATAMGNDYLSGGAGNDTLRGDMGLDVLDGGAGADVLEGGVDHDQATYATATSGVTASLEVPSVNTGDAAGDVYNSIEALAGSAFDDRLFGNADKNALYGNDGNDALYARAGNDALYGGRGIDTLNGGAGADLLDGGDGIDYADYSTSSTGLSVNLNAPASNTGEAAGDTYVAIEGIIGSVYNDTLTGDGQHNILNGSAGNDTLYGGNGGRLY